MVPLGIKVIVASGRPGLCLQDGVISHVALILGVDIVFRGNHHVSDDDTGRTSRTFGNCQQDINTQWQQG